MNIDLRTCAALGLIALGLLSLSFLESDNQCPKCGHPLETHKIIDGSYWCDHHLPEVGLPIPGKENKQ